MNYEELAFFNHQLSAMLRDGIPLEGALKELCAGMKTGRLRNELTQLEDDLGRGVSLKEALPRRQLPVFYLRMVEAGARANDLPGMLTLLADYYERANALWNRLKGLMVYPFLVIGISLALTLLLSVVFRHFLADLFAGADAPSWLILLSMWAPPIFLAILAVAGAAAISVPALRAWLRWRLPAFREASLAELASAMALMLKNGTTLPEAFALLEFTEGKSPAGRALGEWRRLVEIGQGKPAQWPAALPPFPPMFLWLVQKGGEDLAAGFQKAADMYRARAAYRIEMLMYGLLPVSVLLLGQMIFWQIAPMLRVVAQLMNSLGDFSD